MKIWLVIKREYWTRVRKKSFIITTLLVPLLFAALFAVSIGIQMMKTGDKQIAVIDKSGLVAPELKGSDNIHFKILTGVELEAAKKIDSFDAVLNIPVFDINRPDTFDIYSNKQLGFGAQKSIETEVNDILVNKRIQAAGIDIKLVDDLRKKSVKLRIIDKEGKESKNEVAVAIGWISGLLLYMFMFFYGFNVMRSVMEEKTNRIAEIIVSSIKPFQLMMGKIIGVALVGLTQFLLWVVLIGILSTAGGLLLGSSELANNPELAAQMANDAAAMGQGGGINQDMIRTVMSMFDSLNWISLLLWFIFYFLGGYFLYAALFAAVGSLVDEDAQEGQSLTLPVTLPIILGFLIMTNTVQNPNSGLAIFGSVFPFTSPIVMMARIPYGITGDMIWQLALSVVLLIAGFLFTTWIAAKIYRTGILLYGKKVTLKEVGKWLFKKSI